MAIISEVTKVISALREHKIVKVFDDVSVDETKSDAVDARNYINLVLIVESGVGVNAGVVKFEAAATPDYAGTWKEIGSLTTSAASTVYAALVSGNAYPYVRARIETAIGVGSVDAYIALQR